MSNRKKSIQTPVEPYQGDPDKFSTYSPEDAMAGAEDMHAALAPVATPKEEPENLYWSTDELLQPKPNGFAARPEDLIGGQTPLQYLLDCVGDIRFSYRFRAQCATAALPFVHRRLSNEDSPPIKPQDDSVQRQYDANVLKLLPDLTNEQLKLLENLRSKMNHGEEDEYSPNIGGLQ